ncbi:WD repeat-containing protein 19 [Nowakowskiella sp. JEL0078]|nr:WD repeat-containing protein 19 [Nowakowskiella sp. JEL0078]
MKWSLQSENVKAIVLFKHVKTHFVQIAIGTIKGNLLLYSRITSKKIPILGKHTKAIISMSWNSNNILACASDDHTVKLF